MKITKEKSHKGFTIVETLVAIAILMIAIAGPLSVANKAYTAALDARNETIAIGLAQEAMEYANSFKDNTGDIQHTFGSFASGLSECNFSARCGVSPMQAANPMADFSSSIQHCPAMNNCDVTHAEIGGYSYLVGMAGGENHVKTPFKREFYVSAPMFAGGWSSDETMAYVEVSWKTGSVTNAIVLRQIMTEYPRGL